MDWPLVIDRNRTALMTIIVALMGSLGLVSGGRLVTLPLFLYRRALLILRPAESAVRRLIMIVAHEMALRGFKLRVARRDGLAEFLIFSRPNPCGEPALPAFNLIDPLKIFGREAPDMDGFYSGENSDGPEVTPISAASLGLRILALKKALENLPKHAVRLARWYEQRDAAFYRTAILPCGPVLRLPRDDAIGMKSTRFCSNAICWRFTLVSGRTVRDGLSKFAFSGAGSGRNWRAFACPDFRSCPLCRLRRLPLPQGGRG